MAEAIRAGAVPLNPLPIPLLTHKTTLENAKSDLPRWAEQKSGMVKALIRVGAG